MLGLLLALRVDTDNKETAFPCSTIISADIVDLESGTAGHVKQKVKILLGVVGIKAGELKSKLFEQWTQAAQIVCRPSLDEILSML